MFEKEALQDDIGEFWVTDYAFMFVSFYRLLHIKVEIPSVSVRTTQLALTVLFQKHGGPIYIWCKILIRSGCSTNVENYLLQGFL